MGCRGSQIRILSPRMEDRRIIGNGFGPPTRPQKLAILLDHRLELADDTHGGAPRRDLPARYVSWHTCHDRYLYWQHDGLWDRILAVLMVSG